MMKLYDTPVILAPQWQWGDGETVMSKAFMVEDVLPPALTKKDKDRAIL